MKKILIAYANEPMKYSLKQFGIQAHYIKQIDKVILYTEDDLPQEILQSPLMKYKRGGGYWAWKPYLIWKTLQDNPDGTKMALDVLYNMPGKKIVISSGMIELGDKEYELNKELGKYMKDCDLVILLGKDLTKPIYDGLMEVKYNKKKIHILKDINEAIALINKEKDAYVLIQSDLPDIFN